MYSKERGQVFKSYLALLRPIVLSLLGFVVIANTDIMMIRWLNDKDALPASSLAYGRARMVQFFFVGFTNILAVLTTEYHLKHNYKKTTEALKITFISGLFILLPAILILTYWPFAKDEVNDHMALLAEEYLFFLKLSMLPFMLSETIRKYLQGIGWLHINATLTILQGLLNFIFNYIGIYGFWCLPAMGLAGIALSTLLVRTALCCCYLYLAFVIHRRGYIKLEQRSLWSIDYTLVKRIAYWGVTGGITLASYIFLQQWTNEMVKEVDKDAIRGLALLNVVSAPFRLFAVALGIVASLLMRRASSEGDKQKEHSVIDVGYSLSLLIGCLIAGVVYCFFPQLARLFSNKMDERVVAQIDKVMPLIVIRLIIGSMLLLGLGLLTGQKDAPATATITGGAYLLFGIPLMELLGYWFTDKIQGVLLGNVIAMALAALLAYLRIITKRKRFSRGLNGAG